MKFSMLLSLPTQSSLVRLAQDGGGDLVVIVTSIVCTLSRQRGEGCGKYAEQGCARAKPLLMRALRMGIRTPVRDK